MNNILVPTDFSPKARHAFEVALHLAKHTGGRITLLHVLDLAEAGGGFSSSGSSISSTNGSIDQIFAIKLMESTKRRLHDLMREAATWAADVPVHDAVETDRIGEGILAAIKHHDIDLVVMGTQGYGATEHFFVGSNTERIIRLSPCPVLTVKHEQEDFEVRNIVFPSDFTEEAALATDRLHQVLAAFPDATLHLLHVASDRDEHGMRQHMQAFAERAQLPHVQTGVVTAKSTVAGIEEFAQQVNADLVIIPTHARTGLSSFFRTSIAETVATHAFPPVLTYHFR